VSAVTCPGCGTVTYLDSLRRHAEEFCRTCDYPLFWSRDAAVLAGGDAVGEGAGLRRLPGTAGRVTLASTTCWACDEPNLALAELCVRCGVDLSGPPPEPEPEPEPEPDDEPWPDPEPWQEPEVGNLLVWLVLGILAVALIVLLLVTSG